MDWPRSLRKVDQDPLLWAAAFLRFLADTAAYVVRFAYRISDWLVALALALRDRYGEDWPVEFGLGPLWETAP